MEEPAVAVAVVNGAIPDTVIGGSVVTATAVGAPVQQVARVHSNTVDPAAPPPPVDESIPVAEGYVYSPFMAKIFAGLDVDHSGFLETDEITSALEKLGLESTDAQAAIEGFDTNGDGKVGLDEWEAGMKPEWREAIAAKVGDGGDL